MNKNPLVSIIVPAYKAETYISRCIESLINQTYSNIEILVIENGPSSRSNKICKAFCDSRIYYTHSEKKGVSHARNIGLNLARGEYIAFCDADDYYTVDHIEKSVQEASSKKADIVISGYFHEQNNVFKERVLPNSGYMSIFDVYKNILLTDFVMGACWNKLFRKSIIRGIYFPEDISILEDTYFLIKVLQRTNRIYYLSEALYYYCTNSNSAVHAINSLFSRDKSEYLYVTSYNKILRDFELENDIQELIKAIIFELSLQGKFLALRKNVKSKLLFNNLDRNIKSNRRFFFSSEYIPASSKIKYWALLRLPFIKTFKDRMIDIMIDCKK